MTAVNVKSIPEDVAQFILKTQWEIKQQKISGSVSQSQAVIHIIKEYKKLFSNGKQS